MSESLIIGYGVMFDDQGRVMLLRRRSREALWPGQWWLPGDVTPLSEEPDDTVPRLFAQLMRQRVRAVYAHTVYGPEPASRRHTIHNAYLVTVKEALDGAPDDESNPFDAVEWWDASSALAELPEQQGELLATVIERLDSGWDFEANASLEDLFAEDVSTPATPQPAPDSLTDRVAALTRIAARVAAGAALGRDLDLDADFQKALSLGWTRRELEQVGVIAAELGRNASLDCSQSNDHED
ncbi:MAG: hypothetical protein OXH13_11095 [Chloroflexi bacterium]|nr:hypothetical protein [Chloroflexota bacterium]MCY3697949.1 hypothetical protein [Chloroflexota bacterium]